MALPPPCADCLEIREPSGSVQACIVIALPLKQSWVEFDCSYPDVLTTMWPASLLSSGNAGMLPTSN
jgi:hypothetical protein